MENLHFTQEESMSWDAAAAPPVPATASGSTTNNNDDISNQKQQQPQGNEEGNWDAKTQPLSTLYQDKMILSPTHNDHEDEEEGEEGTSPVVGEIIDFDEHVMPTSSSNSTEIHEISSSSSASGEDGDEEEQLEASMAESLLDMEILEGVFAEAREQEEEEETEAETLKKRSPVEISEKHHPAKKAKKMTVSPVPAEENGTIVEKKCTTKPGESSKQPRRKRPNCLFVNHFGTRLNEKGVVMPVNVPAETHASNKTPGNSKEIEITKTENAASIGKVSAGDSQKTPVKNVIPDSPLDILSPTRVPSVVRIVTPTTTKPIASSARIEDIHMEEDDDLEPIKHDGEFNGVVLDSNHLPFIHSLTNETPTTTGPDGSPCPSKGMGAFHPGLMAPPIPSVNFNRPFPLLRRRAFLNNCHPMAGHPGAFAAAAAAAAAATGAHHNWPGFGPSGPFASQLGSSAAATSANNNPTVIPAQGVCWQE